MTRVLTLVALLAAGAALALQQRRLEQTQHDYDSALNDLIFAEERQHQLVDERELWVQIAREQQAALAHLIGQPPRTEPIIAAAGGVWLFKDGWHAARGPFRDFDEARPVAESEARLYPSELIHLLASVSSVVTGSPEPQWEHHD